MITLRPVEMADIGLFYEHQADPVATKMAAFPARDRAAHVAHWTTRILPNPHGIARTVVVVDVVVGNILSWRDFESNRRLLGYWIAREFWGRGIATEALRAFVREVSERPLYAQVAVHNVGSQRVLEKNGFVQVDRHTSPEGGLEELEYRLD